MLCDYTPSNQLSDNTIRDHIRKVTGEYRCDEQEKEEFDILKLDEDDCEEWSHRKILNRLHNHNIDCYYADMWGCDEIAFLSGINVSLTYLDRVAEILNLHKECIYYDVEHSFMILNLFQEKILRERESSP